AHPPPPRPTPHRVLTLAPPRPGAPRRTPAAGTCGSLANAYQHFLETPPRPDNLTYDEDGYPHHLIGDQLSADEHKFLQTTALTGYDNDSGMTMLRIGCMNMMATRHRVAQFSLHRFAVEGLQRGTALRRGAGQSAVQGGHRRR